MRLELLNVLKSREKTVVKTVWNHRLDIILARSLLSDVLERLE